MVPRNPIVPCSILAMVTGGYKSSQACDVICIRYNIKKGILSTYSFPHMVLVI